MVVSKEPNKELVALWKGGQVFNETKYQGKMKG